MKRRENVPVDLSEIKVTFDENIDKNSVDTGSLFLFTSSGSGTTPDIDSVSVSSKTATFKIAQSTASDRFTPGLTYIASISSNIQDQNGNFLDCFDSSGVDDNCEWDFRTVDTSPNAPVAISQSVSTNEDTPKVLRLNATDADAGSLTYSIVSQPSHGTLTDLNPTTGSVKYSPSINYKGPDSFTFKANDGQDSNVATISITVNPVNDPPVANNQDVSTTENSSKSIILTASDVDGNSLTYSIVSQPTQGVLSGLNASSGNVTYTPNVGYTGTDSFTFKANDGSQDSNVATVEITIGVSSLTPSTVSSSHTISSTAIDTVGNISSPFIPNSSADNNTSVGGSDSVMKNETSPDESVSKPSENDSPSSPLENDTDASSAKLENKDTSSKDSQTQPSPDSVTEKLSSVTEDKTISQDTSPDSKNLPDSGSDSSDSSPGDWALIHKYLHSGNDNAKPEREGKALSRDTTEVNNRPVAINDKAMTNANVPVNINILRNDKDADGDKLSIMGLSPPRQGTVVPNPDGTITYSPLKSWAGTETFAYTISDGNGGVAAASVAVIVQPTRTENYLPEAQDQDVAVNENSPVKIKLDAKDSDDDNLRFVLLSKPSHGKIVQFSSSTGTLTYMPDENYDGKDDFAFKVHDGTVFSKDAKVSIKIQNNEKLSNDQVQEKQQPNKEESSQTPANEKKTIDENSNSDTPPNDSNQQPSPPPTQDTEQQNKDQEEEQQQSSEPEQPASENADTAP